MHTRPGTARYASDELLAIAVSEEFVFVTNNQADFIGLCSNAELHTGLVVLPQRPRDAQLPFFSDAITHIEHHAGQAHEAPGDWMLNRVVDSSPTTDESTCHGCRRRAAG